MFESVGEAVAAHRAAAVAHLHALDHHDQSAASAVRDRIHDVVTYLRAHHCADLIFPLTMERATTRGDPDEHDRYRALVDTLLNR